MLQFKNRINSVIPFHQNKSFMLILQQNLKNKYQTIDNDTLKFRAG